MSDFALVLDAGAIAAYATGDADIVGTHLVGADMIGIRAAVPTTCLAEAYAILGPKPEAIQRIRLLLGLPCMRVVPMLPGQSRAVGLLCHDHADLARLGMAHTIITAVSSGAAVMTSSPLVGDYLPAEWPIIVV
ncbi:hypothetical protein AB0M43_39230 [Longispora sp. NPDC051575]|uniref:hypothetical protein n=1 Tax=Longispora sp. NPDC051575 TaxID=3154943 RepID=UPI0034331C6B